MPVTPFHFGPGLLLKAAFPRAVSFTAFAAANVLIDVESVANRLLHRYPVHTALHTFPGATVVGVLTGLLVGGVGHLRRNRRPEWRLSPALLGGVLGGLSHVVLDGVMHPDIGPLLPLTASNPLFHLIGIGTLHAVCVLCGALGLPRLVFRRQRQETEQPL